MYYTLLSFSQFYYCMPWSHTVVTVMNHPGPFIYHLLKGSYDVAKKNIIWCIWCNAMCLCSSFWEARCALIGQLSSALWLDVYLKRETEMLRPSPHCDGVSRCDNTKAIKPIINEVFVASSGDIITDYNDLLSCIAPRKHYHVCICDRETTNNKHYSTQLKTHVWIVEGKFFK